MIKVSSLSKSFGDQTLFQGVAFSVNKRERVGLVGRNGHGKTTLFRLILDQLTPDSGTISIPKKYSIGHVDQQLSFSRDTVLGEAALGLPPQQRDQLWKAEKILFGLGFTEADMQKPPEVFSGGYQVRLNLAKVLIAEPDMLLLDEPTNYLDIVSIRWLSRFLRSWRSELMLITHDRSFMDSVTTHTMAIHRKKIKKIEGGTEKLYAQILKEEEIHEKTRINDEKKRKEVERFIERFRAKNTLASMVQSRVKFLAKHQGLEKLEKIQALDFSFNYSPFPANVMMRAQNIRFAYNDGPELLSGFSLEIRKHDRICVMGQNGKGKSTLLRLLARELAPAGGSITTHSKLETGYFAQTNLSSLNPNNTVVEEITSAGRGCLPQTARNIAAAMMFEGDHALKKVSVLSGGEKSRLMLGKLLVTPCNLLLLDEPTNHLDMDSCDSLLAAIDAFDGAVIIVTHNEMFLQSLATRFVVFDRGKITEYSRSYRDFLDEIGWEMDENLRRRDEMDASVRGKEAGDGPTPLDKKSLRQARARILQEKSRVAGPLDKKVKKLENDIVKLEADAEVVLEKLREASIAGDGPVIAKYSRKNEEIKAQIEALFEELETAAGEYEKAAREFDDRLDELN